MKEHKILVSSGYGSGWSSECYFEAGRRLLLTYPPLITALESDPGLFKDHKSPENEPVIRDLIHEFDTRFGQRFNLHGLDGLYVATIDGPFIVEQYDGSEYIQTRDGTDWIDLDLEN